MSVIAIIPAKGHSVGVPDKNTRLLGDKELVKWTIDAALDTGIDKILFSSESSTLCNIAQSYVNDKIFVYVRPYVMTHDLVQVDMVSWYVLLQACCDDNVDINNNDTVVILQPTSPFRTSRHIDEAIELFELFKDDENPTLASVSSVGKFIYYTNPLNNKLEPVGHDPMVRHGREQYDMDEMPYAENGAIYICTVGGLLNNKTFRSNNPVPYVMGDDDSIEIDTMEDWDRATRMVMSETLI
jgi:CMP-N-acetylneuraminic acid synthetase